MQTTLQVGDGNVTLEYQLGKQIVVFSHGFGVRQDARGMFTDIVSSLPQGVGHVLFDYDVFDAETTQQTVIGFAERVVKLQAVLDWSRKQPGVEQIHLVGHSMGALTIAELAPEAIGKMVLLAPPLSLGLRFAELYTKLPGARHEGHTWFIPRTDATTTVVDDDQLAELMSVDAEGELAKLALFRPYTIILPGADEILPDADYTELITLPSVNMEGVERADHDFTGEARKELVSLVVSQLSSGMS